MEKNTRVMIENLSPSRVVIDVPDLRFERIWENKGVKKPIPFDTLEEIIYNDGVRQLFETGVLYIESLEVKKLLGLEPEDATEPVNIIPLDEKKQKEILSLPFEDFKQKLSELRAEQVLGLTDFCIINKQIDLDKAAYLKDITGIDIQEAIRLRREEMEN